MYITVQLPHYILKSNQFGMTSVRVFVKIISISIDKLCFESAVECTASYFV